MIKFSVWGEKEVNMKKSLLLLPLTMAFLCGCKESSTIQTYQPPINVETSIQNEEATVKKTNQKATKNTKNNTNKNTKTTTTTTTAPKTNNSTIKDLIIDGNGNLVATTASNAFKIIGPVQGAQGPVGPQGPEGARGQKGEDGRGIDHCELDADKNLIIHYTDGTSQNVGCVAVSETPKHDYEQVGYELACEATLPYTNENGTLNSISIKLVSVDENNPSRKYTYSVSINCEASQYTNAVVCRLDGVTKWIGFPPITKNTNSDITVELKSSIPYVKIESACLSLDP